MTVYYVKGWYEKTVRGLINVCHESPFIYSIDDIIVMCYGLKNIMFIVLYPIKFFINIFNFLIL